MSSLPWRIIYYYRPKFKTNSVLFISDKIDIMKNWREKLRLVKQQHSKMKFKNTKIHFKNAEFYATVRIRQNEVLIDPDDNDRDPITFTESRLDGARGLASAADTFITPITLSPRNPNKLSCHFTFKTMRQTDRAPAAISAFMT
jgi:hypothetical protein